MDSAAAWPAVALSASLGEIKGKEKGRKDEGTAARQGRREWWHVALAPGCCG